MDMPVNSVPGRSYPLAIGTTEKVPMATFSTHTVGRENKQATGTNPMMGATSCDLI